MLDEDLDGERGDGVDGDARRAEHGDLEGGRLAPKHRELGWRWALVVLRDVASQTLERVVDADARAVARERWDRVGRAGKERARERGDGECPSAKSAPVRAERVLGDPALGVF
jgi:hypothetical protein